MVEIELRLDKRLNQNEQQGSNQPETAQNSNPLQNDAQENQDLLNIG